MKLSEIKQNWAAFMGLGIALVVLGVLAIGAAQIAGIATAIFFGILLMIAGVGQCSEAIWSRRFSGFLIYLLTGTLYFFIGLFMVLEPLRASVGLAFVVAVLFLLGGIFRIALALQTQYFSDWLWRFFSGIISLMLAFLILTRKELAPDIIGILVGIDLLLTGWTVIMLAWAARNFPTQNQFPPSS